jgi:hypothetical protein
MTFFRPGCLRPLAACLLCSLPLLAQQAAPPSAQQAPSQAPPPAQGQPPAQPPRQNNPFEAVPQSQQETPQQPQGPRLETPAPTVQQARPGENPPEDVIDSIEFRGARRVPQDTLRALIFTKKGRQVRRRNVASRLHGAVEHRPLRRHPHGARGRAETGWIVRFVPWWSGASFGPSNTTASSPFTSPKCWIGSRSARSA